MQIEFKKARKNLMIIWISFSSLIFILMMIQHLNGKFEDKSKDAWIWFTSNITPYLTLVCSGFILDAKSKKTLVIDRIYYRLSLSVSLFYLLTLLFIILMSPFSSVGELQYLKEANVFIIIIQSILSSLIGVFYIHGTTNK